MDENSDFKVSVVIPVYNAARFIEKAVISALEQHETFEVILAEDGSTDNSFEICTRLANANPLVKLVNHPNRANLGAAKTRNLGLKNAEADYISFLDADDFYCRGRFTSAKEIFNSNKLADGVYEAIGTYCYDESSGAKHFERMKAAKKDHSRLELTTIDTALKPEELFEALLFQDKGWIHLNGLTIKKASLLKAGFFDESLTWSEDDEFFLRLSYSLKLFPCRITEPVAMRGIHDSNFTLSSDSNKIAQPFNILLWRKMIQVMLQNNFSRKANRTIVMRHLDNYNHKILKTGRGLERKFLKSLFLTKLLIKHPNVLNKLR
jgi:glycosyltransferase involved in cell wall biosynthesis